LHCERLNVLCSLLLMFDFLHIFLELLGSADCARSLCSNLFINFLGWLIIKRFIRIFVSFSCSTLMYTWTLLIYNSLKHLSRIATSSSWLAKHSLATWILSILDHFVERVIFLFLEYEKCISLSLGACLTVLILLSFKTIFDCQPKCNSAARIQILLGDNLH